MLVVVRYEIDLFKDFCSKLGLISLKTERTIKLVIL